MRWFRRLLYRIRNRKHRKLKDKHESQPETEDVGQSHSARPSTSGYDQSGSTYLQREQQKRAKRRSRPESEKDNIDLKDCGSKQTQGYSSLNHPAHLPAQPNRYETTPKHKQYERTHRSAKAASNEAKVYHPIKEIEYSPARKDSIPLQLELHPIYDLHDANSRPREAQDENLTSPEQFLEDHPNLSPRVRESINRVNAWDIRHGQCPEPDRLSDGSPDESPTDFKPKVSRA